MYSTQLIGFLYLVRSVSLDYECGRGKIWARMSQAEIKKFQFFVVG